MPLSVWCDGQCRITDQFTQAGRLNMCKVHSKELL